PGALQECQPEVPPGGHGGAGGQHPDRRRQSDPDGGSLLCGERGAGGGHCQSGEGQRRHHAAGGRLQAPDLPLLLPGPGGHGFGVPEGGPAGDRPPHRDGADG
ncbi:Anti-sigma factor antagonist, partial [Dysosmobacter welbionis]